jgi:hypothetical protein
MAVRGTTGSSPPRNDLCRRCGTVIDFLSSCPSCGTVAGIDPSLSDGPLVTAPKLTLVSPPVERREAPPAPVADGPWAAPRKSALPAELVRAWDVSATPRTRPATTKRVRRVVAGVLALAVVGGVVGGIVAANSRGGVGAPPVVRTYQAPGAPFMAAFPTPPSESYASLDLYGKPYVATAYTAFSGRQVFSATVYPFPLGLPTMSAQQFLRMFTSKIARTDQLTIPGTVPTTFRGLPALQAVLVSPAHTSYTKLLAVLDGHVAYVLMVSGSSPMPDGYAAFVASFRLAAG